MEALVFEGSLQSLLHQLEISWVGGRVSVGVAHTENAEHRIVAAWKNIGTQNVQRHNGNRSGDFCQQAFALPRAEGHNRVSLLRHNLPFDCWRQQKLFSRGDVLEKQPE